MKEQNPQPQPEKIAMPTPTGLKRWAIHGTERTVTTWYVDANTAEEAREIFEDGGDNKVLWDLTEIDDTYHDIVSVDLVTALKCGRCGYIDADPNRKAAGLCPECGADEWGDQ